MDIFADNLAYTIPRSFGSADDSIYLSVNDPGQIGTTVNQAFFAAFARGGSPWRSSMTARHKCQLAILIARTYTVSSALTKSDFWALMEAGPLNASYLIAYMAIMAMVEHEVATAHPNGQTGGLNVQDFGANLRRYLMMIDEFQRYPDEVYDYLQEKCGYKNNAERAGKMRPLLRKFYDQQVTACIDEIKSDLAFANEFCDLAEHACIELSFSDFSAATFADFLGAREIEYNDNVEPFLRAAMTATGRQFDSDAA